MTTYGVDRSTGAGGTGTSSTTLLADGSVPLTGDWNSGSTYIITAAGFDFPRLAANPGDTDTLWLSDATTYETGTLVWENKLVVLGETSFGAPGTEQGSITVNGASFDAIVKVNDFSTTYDAGLVLHRHSTTAGQSGAILFAKSNTATSSHAAVTSGHYLGSISAAGHDGTDYALGATIAFIVGTTPGANDMPTDISFLTSADGSQTPTEAARIYYNGNIALSKNGGDVTVGGGATASKLKLLEASGSGTNYTSFAAQPQSASVDYTLPAAAPSLNQGVLTSSSAGAMSWGSTQIGKNAIINGAFDIWQRGTTLSLGATTSGYLADRWFINQATDGAVDYKRSTDVPTVAEAGVLANYSLHVDVTTADGTIAAGQFCNVQQRIEGYNWRKFAQRGLTLSFWVKSTTTGTHCVSVGNGVDRSYIAEYTINAANTWEKKTINITASPSAGTWDYTTGVGLYLGFCLAVGSTYQGSAGSWASSVLLGSANQTNVMSANTNEFRLALVQLEVGDVATDFEIVDVATELVRCQRYYEIFSAADGFALYGAGTVYSATTAVAIATFKVTKRTAPTITVNSASDWGVFAGTSNVALSSISFVAYPDNAYCELTVAAGLTSGDGCLLRSQNANARIYISAEL